MVVRFRNQNFGAKMARELHDLKIEEIKQMVVNYDKAGVSTGGKWSRVDLVLELERRKPAVYPLVELAQTILSKCAESPSKRITYGDLWLAFNEGPLPAGRAWVKPLTDSLSVLGTWCFDRNLPLINILVVNGGTGEVKENTVEKMWEAAKERGQQVPDDLKEFADQQADASLALSSSKLSEFSQAA